MTNYDVKVARMSLIWGKCRLSTESNHTGNTGETLEETEQLPALTDTGNFFVFLDTGHATRDFGGFPAERRATMFLDRNWDRIDLLEFKDWSKKHDLRTEVGAGACDCKAVFRIHKEKAFSGWITAEHFGPMGDKTHPECARDSRECI